MTPALPLVRLVLVGEASDLGAAGGTDHASGDTGTCELGGCGVRGIAVADVDGGEGDLVGVTETLDVEALALFDAVLLATGLDHVIHRGDTLAVRTRPAKPGPSPGRLRTHLLTLRPHRGTHMST